VIIGELPKLCVKIRPDSYQDEFSRIILGNTPIEWGDSDLMLYMPGGDGGVALETIIIIVVVVVLIIIAVVIIVVLVLYRKRFVEYNCKNCKIIIEYVQIRALKMREWKMQKWKMQDR